MANRRGNGGSSDRFPLPGKSLKSLWIWLQPWNQKMIASWQESDDKSRQCVEKQRCYPVDKGLYSQGCGLLNGPVFLSELDHKKTEHQRIDAFKLWCWRRLRKVLWTARRSNQSVLREINPEYSLEGLMMKLQCFGHLMQTENSMEKLGKMRERSRAEGEEDISGWDGWMASPKQWTWANFGKWWGTGRPGSCRVRHDWVTEQQWRKTLPFSCRNCSSSY